MEHGELRSAQRSIEETIAHTSDRDLPTARLWHVALRSTNHARMGRWSAAREDAQEVVASGALDGSIWQHLGLRSSRCASVTRTPSATSNGGWSVALTVDEPMRYLPC